MNDYPSEIRYKPIPPVALLGVSREIHGLLERNLSMIQFEETGKIPPFRFLLSPHHDITIPTRKVKKSPFDVTIQGMLPCKWLLHVCYEIPSVIVFAIDWDLPESKNKEYDYLIKLENLRFIRRKTGPIQTFQAAVRSLSYEHYYEEARFIKKHKAKLTKSSQTKLFVRHYFKIAFYSEIFGDIHMAIKYYIYAYNYLKEVRKIWKDAEEMRNMAEVIMFKLCYLCLERRDYESAIAHFQRHINYYRSLVGNQDYEFQHLAWVARQYQVFGELLQVFPKASSPLATTDSPTTTMLMLQASSQSLRSIPNSNLPSISTSSFSPNLIMDDVHNREIEPKGSNLCLNSSGYYYQAAAQYQMLRRSTSQNLCLPHRNHESVILLTKYLRPYQPTHIELRREGFIGQRDAWLLLDPSKLTLLVPTDPNIKSTIPSATTPTESNFPKPAKPVEQMVKHPLANETEEPLDAMEDKDIRNTTLWPANVLPHHQLSSLYNIPPKIEALINDEFAVSIAQELNVNHSQTIIDILNRARIFYTERAAFSKRIVLHLMSQIALEYFLAGNYIQAKRINDTIIPAYRREKWWHLLTPILHQNLQCIIQLQLWQNLIPISIELIHPRIQLTRNRKTEILRYLLQMLVSETSWATFTSTSPIICVQRNDTYSFIECQVQFEKHSTMVHVPVMLRVILKSHAPIPIRFSTLQINLSAPEYNIVLVDEESPWINEKEINLPIDPIDQTKEDLILWPDITKIYSFQITFNQPKIVRCTGLSLTLAKPPASVEFLWRFDNKDAINLDNIKTQGIIRSRTRRQDSHSLSQTQVAQLQALTIRVQETKPKVEFQVVHSPPALTSEEYPIQLTMINQEDSITQGRISLWANTLSTIDTTLSTSNAMSTMMERAPYDITLDDQSIPIDNCSFLCQDQTQITGLLMLTPCSLQLNFGPITAHGQLQVTTLFKCPPVEVDTFISITIHYDTANYCTSLERQIKLRIQTPFQAQFDLYDQTFKPMHPTCITPSQAQSKHTFTTISNGGTTLPPLINPLTKRTLIPSSPRFISIPSDTKFQLRTQLTNNTNHPIRIQSTQLITFGTAEDLAQVTTIETLQTRNSIIKVQGKVETIFVLKSRSHANQDITSISENMMAEGKVQQMSGRNPSSSFNLPQALGTFQVEWDHPNLHSDQDRAFRWTAIAPLIVIRDAPFTAKIDCVDQGTFGQVIKHVLHLTNNTNSILPISLDVMETPGFAVAGDKFVQYPLNAKETLCIHHHLVPLLLGFQPCPILRLKINEPLNTTEPRHDAFLTELQHSTMFVKPSLKVPYLV